MTGVVQADPELARELALMCDRRVISLEYGSEQTASAFDPFAARARMAHKPGALRSLDVCLDSRGPFIDVNQGC
jgi:hypothetical protein